MKKKESFFILDGSSLLHRAFHGIALLNAPTGEPTNAIYGFSNMLIRLLEDWNPNYLVIAFDKSKKTFRNKMYPEYKANRKPIDPPLKAQIPILRDMVKAWGIDFEELDGYEADDIIGTLSRKAAEAGMDTYVVTGDKDALQLIRKEVKVLYTKKGVSDIEVWDEEKFHAAYEGLDPIKLIDIKGLMGDHSDNIPGIKGVGIKTAISLLNAYDSVENIILHGAELSNKKAREEVVNNPEQIMLSKRLATINQDTPIEFNIDKFGITYNLSDIHNFYNKYSMFSIIRSVDRMVGKLGLLEANNEEEEEYKLPIFEDFSTYEGKAREIWVSLRYNGKVPHILPLGAAICCDGRHYYTEANSFSWMKLEEILQDNAICKNIYNLKAFRHAGLDVNGKINDLMLIAYLVDSVAGNFEPISLAEKYLEEDFGIEDLVKRKENIKKLSQKEQEDLDIYECKWNVAVFERLSQKLLQRLKEFGLEKLYLDMELPLVEVLYDMEKNGIYLNREKIDEQSIQNKKMLYEIEEEIYKLAGEKFNINSPKQLGVVLFEKLQLPVAKKTKTGYSTNAEVLEKLLDKHPIIEKLLSYRTLKKLQSTYLDVLGTLIDKETNRIHTSFNQIVTATGRLSSSNPNLQNIPVRSEEGKRIRGFFEPGDGFDTLISADYSQIELRILAAMSNDASFIKAFKAGEDIHARTAAEIFNVPIEEVTPKMRSNAKAVNFGIVYGITDYGLSEGLNISRYEAAEYIKNYLDKCPGIKSFLEKIIADAKKKLFVETLYGRRRGVAGINSSNKNISQAVERIVMNTPIQGTAADIIKLAMLRVFEEIKKANLKSRILLQVHDELVLETVEEEIPRLKEILKNAMEEVARLSVPLSVDIKLGSNWSEAK